MFTLTQLRRGLVLELTRADISFARCQAAAQTALASDLVPNGEHIHVRSLEIEQLELTLGLVVVRSNVFKRLWCRVSAWWSGQSSNEPVYYRFAAPGEDSVRFACVIRRDAQGRFSGQLDPV